MLISILYNEKYIDENNVNCNGYIIYRTHNMTYYTCIYNIRCFNNINSILIFIMYKRRSFKKYIEFRMNI